MTFNFIETEPDDALSELNNFVGVLVGSIVMQYKIETNQQLNIQFFRNQDNYILFFKEFADYANSTWNEKFSGNWDFKEVPFRESSKKIDGVIKILRTGGPYSEVFEKNIAMILEEEFRKKFQKDSSELVIFCIADYKVSESLSFTVDIHDLGKISTWFELIAWDDLIFIINPNYNTLYVIAFTDED